MGALTIAIAVASGALCLGLVAACDPGGVVVSVAEDATPVVKARQAGLCRRRGLAYALSAVDLITSRE